MEQLTAAQCQEVIRSMAAAIAGQRDTLSALDAVLGDGDHGHNMAAALSAAVAALDAEPLGSPAALFERVGATITNEMGGASGVIFGAFFTGGGRAVRGRAALTLADLHRFFAAGLIGVQQRGKAESGDKTMLDALEPAAEALERAKAANLPLAAALAAAAEAARQGAASTTNMVARHGRARFLGQRSLGTQDAGATSIALMLAAWAELLRQNDSN